MAIKPKPTPRPSQKFLPAQKKLPMTPGVEPKTKGLPMPSDPRKTARQKSMQKYF